MTDSKPCLNEVFVWDGPLCSEACRRAWCHANDRTPASGLLNPPIVHPAAELDGHGWEHGDIVAIACPDGTTKRLRVVDEPAPPIVHAAGVIPPEVEQAVTEQIERRLFAGFTATAWPAPTPPSFVELAEILRNLRPPPEPVEVTRERWEWLKARYPAPPDYGIHSGQIGSLIGVPVKIIEPDSAPRPGWLSRLSRRLRRWFG